MQIRKMIKEDISKVDELLYSLNQMHKDNIPNDYKTAEEIAEKIDMSKYIDNNKEEDFGFVACNDNKEIIGFILGSIWERKSLVLKNRRIVIIMDIIVDDRYHGDGTGKELYQQFEQQARKLNAEEVLVEVYEFNQQAMDFYQSCGIKPFIHSYKKEL